MLGTLGCLMVETQRSKVSDCNNGLANMIPTDSIKFWVQIECLGCDLSLYIFEQNRICLYMRALRQAFQ